MGKLIVIEGTDSSGKNTQSKLLYKRLADEGYNIKKVEYPNYASDSSALVKMYLGGAFGSNPEDVNPYVASTFFAVDRFASYKMEWKSFYEGGGIVIADRYTTSNMVHQASKIDDAEEKDRFLQWLWDFEFNKFSLPVPDCVFFLDMPVEISSRLMEKRNNKINGQEEKDIHEKDRVFLERSYKNACFVAEKYKWERIRCVRGEAVRTIEEIHEEIYEKVINIIKK